MIFNNLVHLEKVTSPLKYTTVEFDINSSEQFSAAIVNYTVLDYNWDGYN